VGYDFLERSWNIKWQLPVTPTLSSPAQYFPVLDERKAKFCLSMKETIMMLQVYLIYHLCLYFQKSKKRKKCNVATQTEGGYEAQAEAAPAWSKERANKEVEETWSLAEQVKEAAQTAMQQTGFVYEETSGMYYDYSTGYYYNAVSKSV
jgi:hypothetical protein